LAAEERDLEAAETALRRRALQGAARLLVGRLNADLSDHSGAPPAVCVWPEGTLRRAPSQALPECVGRIEVDAKQVERVVEELRAVSHAGRAGDESGDCRNGALPE